MKTSATGGRISLRALNLLELIRFLPRRAAWSVFLLGLLLTVGASYNAYLSFQTEVDARFDRNVRRAGNAIEMRMNTYLNTLIQTHGFFDTYPGLARNDFRSYVDHILHRYPGVQGIGFVRRVPASSLARHMREVRAEGFPGYHVWPGYSRADYFPIVYLEPFDWRNQRAFGYDMTTEWVRREAMLRAAKTGEPAMSGKVTLVQETDKDEQPGFLIYVPVYRVNAPVNTPEQRWNALLGFVYSPFRAGNLFREALRLETEHLEKVRLDIYDGTLASPEHLLHSVSSDPAGRTASGPRRLTLNIGGHDWTMVASEEPGFVKQREMATPFLVLAAGTLLSFLLFLIFSAEQKRGLTAEESRQKLSAVLESIQDNFVSLDRNWNFTYVNQAAARALDRTPEDLIGRNVLDEFPFVRATTLLEILVLAADRQKVVHFEEHVGPLGAWFEIHAYPVKEGLSVYFRDITEQKRIEEAAREARERFRAAFASATVGMAVVSPDGRFLQTNSAYWRITGYQEEDASRLNFFDLTHPEDRAMVTALTDRLMRGEIASYNINKRYVRKDGRTVWVDGDLSVVKDETGKPINLIAISQDITQQKRAEDSMFSIADGVITTDVDGRVMLINKAAQDMTGWSQEQASQQRLQDVFRLFDSRTLAPVSDIFSRLLQTGQILPAGDCKLRHKDGHERAVSLTTSPIHGDDGSVLGMVLVVHDVTEQAKTEQELIKNRNLEALGVLAGGIAHDFNNILTAILGNLTLARLHSPPGAADASQFLDDAEKASLRARELTGQLLTFAKGGMPIKKTASIADVVEETAVFALRGSSVRPQIEIAPDLWPAEFDASQMSQVINNLIVNAQQAMPKGGTITVSVENATLDLNQVQGLAAGDYVRVRVRDYGIGIPAENISRVFDPYFTTKPHGSGLGLATAYSIAKRHGGGIAVESRVGEGALFTVLLPAARHKVMAIEQVAKPTPVSAGSGRVLVMDDEEPVRQVASRLLERLGYKVTTATDGAEAIRLYEAGLKSGENYDVVILDLTVPGGMGGEECLQKLHALDPSAKAVVSSGYATDPIMAHYRAYGFRGRIVKPYQVSELSDTLHEVVSEAGSPAG